MPVDPNQSAPAFSCDPCGIQYILGAESTVHVFTRQPWFDCLVTKCPKCGTVYRLWGITALQVTNIVAKANPDDPVNWTNQEFADEATVALFGNMTGRPLIQSHDLTPRQIARVAYFAWLLERGDME